MANWWRETVANWITPTRKRRSPAISGRRQRRIGIFVIVEQRVQVSRTRFRVPDICVLAGGKPAEQIITTPPLVVIEILSKDDRAAELQEKVSDYLNFGIAAVWVINPLTRRAWVYTADGAFEAKDGILRSTGPDFELSLPEIFSNLE
jgi:Uma2 family endonuclease